MSFGFSTPDALLAVLGMAAATYALRIGGLLLAGYLPRRGRWAAAFEQVPGAVMVAIVAPAILAAGPLGWIAAAACAGVALRTRNLLLTMLVGIAIVGIARHLGAG